MRTPWTRRPPPSFRTQIGPAGLYEDCVAPSSYYKAPRPPRMADGSDGLYEDCVGPSSYYKAQGIPVRIGGLLANGQLFVTVLPKVGGMSIAKHVPSNPIMIRPKPVVPVVK